MTPQKTHSKAPVEIKKAVSRLLDSELDHKSARELERHLFHCLACARYFDEETKLHHLLRASLAHFEVPEIFGVEAPLRQRTATTPPRGFINHPRRFWQLLPPWPLKPALSYAFAVIIGLGLGIGLGTTMPVENNAEYVSAFTPYTEYIEYGTSETLASLYFGSTTIAEVTTNE